MSENDSSSITSKISEKTMISLQMVVALLTLTVWLIRLGTRVEQYEKEIDEIRSNVQECSKYDKRIYRLELKAKLQPIIDTE